jgi:hypothetical protein
MTGSWVDDDLRDAVCCRRPQVAFGELSGAICPLWREGRLLYSATNSQGPFEGDRGMADNAHSAEDFEAHKQSYAAFIKGAQWGTGGVVALLIVMAIFLL